MAWYFDNNTIKIQLLGSEAQVLGQTVCAEAAAVHFVHGANKHTASKSLVFENDEFDGMKCTDTRLGWIIMLDEALVF